MTRPNTPNHPTTSGTLIRIKRACNGCGQHLGDATDPEIQACVDGLPLPDVRAECPTCSQAPGDAR